MYKQQISRAINLKVLFKQDSNFENVVFKWLEQTEIKITMTG